MYDAPPPQGYGSGNSPMAERVKGDRKEGGRMRKAERRAGGGGAEKRGGCW